MGKTFRILVAASTVVVVLFCCGMFVSGILQARKAGEMESGAEYSMLRNALVSLQSKADFRDSLFRDNLAAVYRGSRRLLAAQVLDENSLAIWKIPSDSGYFALPGDSSSRAGFTGPEWSTVVHSTDLYGGMKLSALYCLIFRSDIASAAKGPLLILAAWMVILLAAILLTGRSGKEEIAPRRTEEAEEPAYAEETGIEREAAGFGAVESAFEEDEEMSAGETAGAGAAAGPAKAAAAGQEILSRATGAGALEPAAPEEEAGPSAAPESAAAPAGLEETLARMEEEIAEWSGKREKRAPRAGRTGAEEFAEEEADEVLEEMELAGEAVNGTEAGAEESAGEEDMREAIQEFEDLRLEDEKIAPAGKPAPAADMRARAEAAREEAEAMSEEAARAETASLREEAEMEAARAAPKARAHDVTGLLMPLSLTDSLLEAKLGEEIGRSETGDVALLMVHCDLAGPSDPAAVAIAVNVKEYFGAKELVFELYKGGFGIVLPSMDIGGALKISEDFADVLSTTLSLYRDMEEEPVFIGISSRSGRPSADASRLYREASAAIHKAYSGGSSRILAFRPKAV